MIIFFRFLQTSCLYLLFVFSINVVSLEYRADFDNYLFVITLSLFISFKVELKKVIEVRCGQQTRNFNQFPYLEVEKQSFSLMFNREQGESILDVLSGLSQLVFIKTP